MNITSDLIAHFLFKGISKGKLKFYRCLSVINIIACCLVANSLLSPYEDDLTVLSIEALDNERVEVVFNGTKTLTQIFYNDISGLEVGDIVKSEVLNLVDEVKSVEIDSATIICDDYYALIFFVVLLFFSSIVSSVPIEILNRYKVLIFPVNVLMYCGLLFGLVFIFIILKSEVW